MNHDANDLLRRAQQCKINDFEKLLKEIEAAIQESGNDEKLLRAKKAITTKIASRGKIIE